MKKTILIPLLILGTMATYARKNPYTERIDSVMDSYGNYRETYTYNDDGTMMRIRLYSDDGMLQRSVIDEEDADGRLVHSYQYSYANMGVSYLSGRNDYRYDDRGRLVSVQKCTSMNMRLYPYENTEYVYEGESDKPSSSVCTVSLADRTDITESVFDADGRETLHTFTQVTEDRKVAGERVRYDYLATGELNLETVDTLNTELDEWAFACYRKHSAQGGYEVIDSYIDGASGEDDPDRNSTVYDRYGIVVAEYHKERGTQLADKVFDDRNRLLEAVSIETVPEKKPVRKYEYEYFAMDDGYEYYTCKTSIASSVTGEWTPADTTIYVPNRVQDGVAVDFHAYEGGEVQCRFYFTEKLSKDALFMMSGDRMVITSADCLTYDTHGDVTCVESFSGDDDGVLSLIGRTLYEYDPDVPIGNIDGYRYFDFRQKILSVVSVDETGEEYNRMTYYYLSPAITTAISQPSAISQQSAPIYNLSGQRVSATQPGRIYIKEGKKVIPLYRLSTYHSGW